MGKWKELLCEESLQSVVVPRPQSRWAGGEEDRQVGWWLGAHPLCLKEDRGADFIHRAPYKISSKNTIF